MQVHRGWGEEANLTGLWGETQAHNTGTPSHPTPPEEYTPGYSPSGPSFRWLIVAQDQSKLYDQSFRNSSPFVVERRGRRPTILSPNLVAEISAEMLVKRPRWMGQQLKFPDVADCVHCFPRLTSR